PYGSAVTVAAMNSPTSTSRPGASVAIRATCEPPSTRRAGRRTGMAEKLSERLERIARGQVWGAGDHRTLDEAIELARRVEGAQVGRVDMVCASDAVVVDELDRPVSINKKRVRLVPEPPEAE